MQGVAYSAQRTDSNVVVLALGWGAFISGSQGGRPPAFDREAYKQRNTVERCINKLKQWRGIATRYDKTAATYLAGLHLAGIFISSAR